MKCYCWAPQYLFGEFNEMKRGLVIELFSSVPLVTDLEEKHVTVFRGNWLYEDSTGIDPK